MPLILKPVTPHRFKPRKVGNAPSPIIDAVGLHTLSPHSIELAVLRSWIVTGSFGMVVQHVRLLRVRLEPVFEQHQRRVLALRLQAMTDQLCLARHDKPCHVKTFIAAVDPHDDLRSRVSQAARAEPVHLVLYDGEGVREEIGWRAGEQVRVVEYDDLHASANPGVTLQRPLII